MTLGCPGLFLRRVVLSLSALGAVHLSAMAAEPQPARPSAPAVDENWWRGVERQLQNAEYHPSWQAAPDLPGSPSVWQAPNRAQGLRTYFLDQGIRVMPREDEGSTWHWGLTLVGYHGENETLPVEPAVLIPEGGSVSYHRGVITESYDNGPQGLQQVLTLDAPPEGPGRDVRLDFALDTGLLSVLADDGQSLDFAAADGTRVLRYARPAAVDAAGRVLSARIGAVSSLGFPAVQLVLEDQDAQYPVTLSVLVSAAGWLVEGNQSGSSFGGSVASAGDVNGDGYGDLVVGASRYDNGQTNEGRVFVFFGSASGPGLAPAWQAESNQAEARFGSVVAPAGDVNGDGYADLIVGAPLYDGGQLDEGRVFVYLGSATGPGANPAWTAEANQSGARFGFSVAPAGSVNGDGYADILIGAPLYDNGQKDEGRAFLYLGSAAGLGAAPAWTAEGNQVQAHFGNAVATAGDVNGDGYDDAIVGANYYDNGQKDEGRAFVYRGSAAGTLVPIPWTAEGNQSHGHFGTAVATAGDVNGDGYADVVVGANTYDNDLADEGKVFVYYGSASGPASVASWTAEGNQTGAGFGGAVAPAGDVNGDGYGDLLVSADGYDFGQTDEGRAFLYQGSATGLPVSPVWTAEGNQASGRFGGSVAPAGDVNGDGYSDLLVGSDSYDGDLVDEGRATVFYGAPAGLSTIPKWSFEGDQFDAQLGWSVDGAGDVNGDGYGDVMVASFSYDTALGVNSGKVWVFHGGPGGPDTTPDWSREGGALVPGHTNTQDTLGFGVGAAGDVNGDGYDDVLLGCPQCENVPTTCGEINEGWALLYYGSASGLSLTSAWIGESNQGFSGYGREVSSIGDVNGDGYGDIAVGASLWDIPTVPGCGGLIGKDETLGRGKVFVYYGHANGPSTTPDWIVLGDSDISLFGKEIGSAGDVNGDGYGDMVFSATDYSVVYPPTGTTTGEGRAFVYYGSATGLSATPAWTAQATPNAQGNPQLDSHFGYGCRGAGDVNGDGYSDVIIGAPDYDNPDLIEGRIYVYYGSAAGLSTTPSWTFEGNVDGAYVGIDVQGVGDFNGDGYADVIFGSDGWGKTTHGDPLNNVGRVWFFPGSPTGLGTTPSGLFESGQAYAQAGVNVAAAGDVNGDGYADILFGARRWDDLGDPITCNAPGAPGPPTCQFKDEGKSWILMGNNGVGLGALPQQRRADNSAPIGQTLESDSASSFRVALLGRSPFGRGRVKLEWEVKPYGTPFNGTGTHVGAGWSDTGLAGVALSELASGLSPGTAYHWRVRLRFDPATTPFQHAGRWIAPPHNGALEADLRTAP